MLFPALAIAGSIGAWCYPHSLGEWKPAIIPMLSVIMFSMGMTLTWQHFVNVIKRPGVICLAVSAQFLVMPLSAFYLAKFLTLSQDLVIGMVLVGASAGGTASNVICYLAKGDVALSILLTLSSTLIAIFATPALTYFYINESVPVPFAEMLVSVLKIVLLPVLLGTTLNSLFSHTIEKIRPVFPLFSSLAIVLIIAIIVAVNHASLAEAGPRLVIAVVLHNLCGLVCGYILAYLCGYTTQTCRTVCIEVGMQNSGLSVALAVGFFSPLAALPGAIFSIWHNISGSVLASFWSHRQQRKNFAQDR